MDSIDPRRTAFVAIDLQGGILGMPLQPHAGADIVARSAQIARRCRELGALVVFTNVTWSSDFRDMLQQPVDRPMRRSDAALPAGYADLAPALEAAPGDLRITKRQWSAFHGTELDLQLRRRGIDTVILSGVATNMGVESTARQGWELGYKLVLVEDAIASLSPAMHSFAVETIFPLIGQVRPTDSVLAALA